MSLMSMIGSFTSSGSQSLYSGIQLSPAAQQAIADQAAANAPIPAPTAPEGDTTQISDAAKAAAAAKADNAKDFGELTKEVRANLDAQYTAGTPKGHPDLSGLSGRALASIALNKDGSFSPAETALAKKTLNDQTRASFLSATSSGQGLTALAAYSQQAVTQYDNMSAEERQARGWTDQFRANNQSFVTNANVTSMFG